MMIATAAASSLQMTACLICAIQLFWWHRETRDYTRIFLGICAIWLFLEGAGEAIGIAVSPEGNPFSVMMHPYVVLFGFLSQIMALVYPLCVLHAKKYKPYLWAFLPWVIVALFFFSTSSWTPLHSLEDLRTHIGRYDVVLRLIAIGLYLPYLVYIIYLPLSEKPNKVAVPRVYFWIFSACTLATAFLHFAFFFTGHLMFQILREFVLGAFFLSIAYFDLELRLYPKRAIHLLQPEFSSPEKSPDYVARPLWERICEALDREEVWKDPNLSVEGLAQRCGSNVPYVISCVKTETGYSANEYINRKRIAYVCQCLEEHPQQSLQNLFFEAGYRVRTTAWRNFREIMGVSPSEYRFSRR